LLSGTEVGVITSVPESLVRAGQPWLLCGAQRTVLVHGSDRELDDSFEIHGEGPGPGCFILC